MSVAEMKKKAIEQIELLEDEKALQEIINHLNDLDKTVKAINLTKHFDAAKEKFGEALQKLAQ